MKTKYKSKHKIKSRHWLLYLFIIPALIYLIIFNYIPIYGIIIAFQRFNPSLGYLHSEWVGLEHFARFLNHPEFWLMIRNTLSITLYSLCTFPLPIIFALLLNELKSTRLKKTVQMITYAPHFLSVVVMCSIIILLTGRDGLFGHLYGAVTGQAENLLTIPEYFNDIYVWSGVWQGLGWNSILYISALSGIPEELRDAAKVDGATRLQEIRYVNLPCILPTIIMNFILSLGGLLSIGFDKIFLLQNNLNLQISKVIPTYVYNIGLIGGQLSYSTAVGLFMSLINLSMLMLGNLIIKKLSGSGIF